MFNREHFLRSGGYYEEFSGWGYEDLELNCRMIRKSKDFPTPRDWSLERFNFNTIYEYSGWKAVYRLYGDICFYHGIVLFHGTHKIKQDLLREVQRKKNYQFFARYLLWKYISYEKMYFYDESRYYFLVWACLY